MGALKHQTFTFSNGKQIKLYGIGFGLTKTLEISEASAPNIFWIAEGRGNGVPVINNPHKLTAEEILELADFSIQQWMDLKNNIRKYGVDDSKVFNRESSGK